jgi:RNA polymerase sigma-70 factor (ECF subfamily)
MRSTDGATPRVTARASRATGGAGVDELRLIRGTLRGRREDFAVLVERHQQALYAFVLRYLRDPDAAEDVVQSTFVRAYTALRTFRGDASFKTWLHRIAINECRSRARKQRQLREVALEEVGEAVLPADSPDLASAVDGKGLQAYIDRLAPLQRSVLVMRVFGDLPFKEIARIEGTTEGSAKVSYHNAVKRLKEWMT